jgi:carotenoid cleavage dioxygenase-like enzyme
MSLFADHPYLTGAHTPLRQELSSAALKVRGELPAGLVGSFVRNSGTPFYEPPGRYHWFDGDGMVHAVHFADGEARFCNRWIDTRALRHEKKAGAAVWGGIMDPPNPRLPGGPLKDTANTDVIYFNGRLLALWWLSGQPYSLDIATLGTNGPETFGGTLPGPVSAHAKVCPTSGELVFFNYDVLKAPHYHHGVVSADGKVSHYEEIGTAAPRIPHDIAITEHYTVIPDLPLGWDPVALSRGKFKIAFDHSAPSRWGILPRHGKGGDVRWFELPSSYVYHFCGAWEDGEKVVVLGCKIDDLIPAVPTPGEHIARMDVIELVPYLTRWEFDLATGTASETRLDDRPTEFPRINDRLWGRANRYSYNPQLARASELLFDGVIKYDMQRGSSQTRVWGEGVLGGEVVFAPRHGTTRDDAEDDGYVVTITTLPGSNSELWVLDAQNITAEPLAIVELPAQVPAGFHAEWAPAPA